MPKITPPNFGRFEGSNGQTTVGQSLRGCVEITAYRVAHFDHTHRAHPHTVSDESWG